MSDGKVEILAEIKDKTASAINKIQANISGKLSKLKADAAKVDLTPLKTSAIAAAGAIGAAAVAFAGLGIKSAAELQAINAQFEQVFGDLQGKAKEMVGAMGDEFGMLPNRLTPAFSQMASKFKGLGYDTQTAMGMAKDAVTLAADAAAFYDKSYEEANSALNSFVNGNYEGGEVIGLFANETQMAAYASKELGKDWKNLDEAGKQLVRLEYAKAMQKAAGATGQAARESMTFTNQMANARQALKEFAAAVMEPILDPLVHALAGFANGLSAVTEKVKAFNNFMKEHQAVADVAKIAVLGFAAALLAQGVIALNAYVIGLTGAGIATTAFAAVQAAAGAVMAFFTSPVTLVIAAITALIAAFTLLKNHPDEVKAKFEQLKAFFSGFSPTLDSVKAAFQNLGSSINESMSSLVSKLSGVAALEAPINTLKSKLTELKSAFTEAFTNMNFEPILVMAAGLIPAIIARIVGGVPGLLMSGLLMANKIAEGFGTSLPELLALGMQALTNIMLGIAQAIPQMTAQATTMITQFSTALSAAIPQLLTAGVQILTQLIQGITQALPTIITAGVQIITTLMQAFITLAPMLIMAAIQLITALVQGLVQALPLIINAGLQLIMALATALIQNLPQIISAGVQLITALVDGLIQVLPLLIDAALQLVVALVQAFIDNAPELLAAGIQLIQALITGILTLIGAILGAGVQIISSLLSGVLSLIGELLSAGLQAVGNFIKGIADKIGEVLAKGKEVSQNAYDGAKDKVGEFFSIGADMISGLIKGILDKAKAVAEAAASVVSGAIAAARRAADSHSPSREMIALGKDMDDGTRIGIEKGTKEVAKAAENLVNTAMSKADKAANKAIEKQKQTMEKVYKIVDDTKNKVMSAQEKYHAAVAKTNEKLAQTEQKLTEKYNNEVEKRKDKLISWIGLFDEIPKSKEDELPISGGDLLERLKEQSKALAAWREDITTLETKGVTGQLLEELKEMGPKASKEIHALASMTQVALSEYQEVWRSIQSSAKEQAVIDNAGLAQETRESILKARSEAEKEIQEHSVEYLRTLGDLKDDTVKKFADLSKEGVKLGADFVNNLINGVRNRQPEYVNMLDEFKGLQKKLAIETFNAPRLTQMAAETASLVADTKDEYQDAGKNLMDGMKQGIEDGKSGVINAAVQVAEKAAEEVRRRMDIHSPSGVWKKDIGRWLPAGMAEGMIGNIGVVEKAANLIANASMPSMSRIMQPQIAYATAGGGRFGNKVIDNSKTVHSNPTVVIENLNTTESMKTVREMSEDLAEHAINAERGT